MDRVGESIPTTRFVLTRLDSGNYDLWRNHGSLLSIALYVMLYLFTHALSASIDLHRLQLKYAISGNVVLVVSTRDYERSQDRR